MAFGINWDTAANIGTGGAYSVAQGKVPFTDKDIPILSDVLGKTPGPSLLDPNTGQPDQKAFEYGAVDNGHAQALHNWFSDKTNKAEYNADKYLGDADAARAQALGLMANVGQAENDARGMMYAGANSYGNMSGALDASNSALNAGYGARADAQGALAQSQQARGFQEGLMGSYNDVLSGNAPSVAQMQMQQGVDRANQQAMGLAASTRGGGANALMAMRQAGMQQQANSLGAVNEAAMLRAREQDMARAGAGALAGQMRSGDYSLAQGYQGQRAQDINTAQAQQGIAQGYAQQGAGYGALANTGVGLMGANVNAMNSMQGQQNIDVNKAGQQYGQSQFWQGQKTHVVDQVAAGKQAGETLKSNAAIGVATANQQAQTAANAQDTQRKTAYIGGGATILSKMSGGLRHAIQHLQLQRRRHHKV